VSYLKDDFWLNVQAMESLYSFLSYDPDKRLRAKKLVNDILSMTEVDIGIRWNEGQFLPSGSPLLDDRLVNDVLQCLQPKQYDGVRASFNKGLEHFLHSTSKPHLLSDVVTDMYEALEGLAKIVTGRDRDLSGNAESFISAAKVSDGYKPILKEYVAYANK